MPTVAMAGWFMLSAAGAATLSEDFSADPLQTGWHAFGEASLFAWDATNQNLAVTWDSSRPNSYFYHPLGTILATNDDFSLEFDLRLTDAEAGNYGTELAVGFLRWQDATNAAFLRTSGSSPNVAEFDYFPPSLISASLDATLIDGSNNFYFAYAVAPLNLGQTYHIRLAHSAGGGTLSGEVSTNGQLYASLTNSFGATAADFRLDIVAVGSYHDDGFGDTVLAHGSVDNFIVTVPPPPVRNFGGSLSNGFWQGQFLSQPAWLYTLERTKDFRTWTAASAAAPGDGDTVILQDAEPVNSQEFYRVRAQRP